MTDFKIGDKVTTRGEVKQNPNYHGVVVYSYKKWDTQNVYVQWPNWDEGDHMEYNACDIDDGILIHWTEPVKRNPHAPDFALNLDDIKPGVRVRVVNSHLNKPVRPAFTIKSEPYLYNGNWRIDTDESEYQEFCHSYLSDMGVLPYSRGHWNPCNYTIPDTTDAVVKVLQK